MVLAMKSGQDIESSPTFAQPKILEQTDGPKLHPVVAPEEFLVAALSDSSMCLNKTDDPQGGAEALPRVISSSAKVMRLSTKLRRIKRRLLLEAVGMPNSEQSSSPASIQHSCSQ